MKSPWAWTDNADWNQPLEGETCGKSSDRYQPCGLPSGHEGPCDGWPAVMPVPTKGEHLAEARAVEQHQEEKHRGPPLALHESDLLTDPDREENP